jgi:16S rRNA (guanine966-N2)-methyltransferase
MNRPAPGAVRIIGGRLRGSKLPVPASAGLRPTGDRVRETLFNWLAPMLPGARAIDLFAGTGALGFEAASRGAGKVTMIERDPVLAAALQAGAQRLHVDQCVRVDCADALAWLARAPVDAPYDLAFIDPPFAAGLWSASAAALQPWLAPSAWIYVESARGAAPAVPADWREHRRGGTREVDFVLYRRSPAGTLEADLGEDD